MAHAGGYGGGKKKGGGKKGGKKGGKGKHGGMKGSGTSQGYTGVHRETGAGTSRQFVNDTAITSHSEEPKKHIGWRY